MSMHLLAPDGTQLELHGWRKRGLHGRTTSDKIDAEFTQIVADAGAMLRPARSA